MQSGSEIQEPSDRDLFVAPDSNPAHAVPAWRQFNPMLLAFRTGRWRWPWAVLATLTAMLFGVVLMMVLGLGFVSSDSTWFESETLLRLGILDDYLAIAAVWGAFAVGGIAALRLVKGDPPKSVFTATGRFHIADFYKTAAAIFIVYAMTYSVAYYFSPDDFSRPERAANFWNWLALGLLVILVQSGAEEVFFRGVMVRIWGAVFPYAWIISTLIMTVFISLHLGNNDVQRDVPIALITFVFGETLAYYVLFRTKCLAGPMGLHWANNVFVFFAVHTRPPNDIDTSIFVYTDPVYAAGGSHLLDPAVHLVNVTGFVLIAALLFWKTSPLYLARRSVS